MLPDEKAHTKAGWDRRKAMRLRDKIALLWQVPVRLVIVVSLVLPRKILSPRPRTPNNGLLDGGTMNNNFKTFLANCEALLAQKGVDTPRACVCGYIAVPARVYEDERMTVHQVLAPHKEAGLFEIELWYDRANRPHSTNPVVMRACGGEIFRHHGEWTLLADHAAAKAAELVR